MKGRIAALALVLAGVVGGAAMYYLQVYAYYDRLPPRDTLRMQTRSGAQDLPITGFAGIDSDSSPIRFRACFNLPDLPEGAIAHDDPQPLNAPGWFDCFDAGQLADDLGAGQARAYLVDENFRFGFDRVMARYLDGRSFLWHQMNACGEAHFDGRTMPQGCPPAPES
ncbi:MAG: hypothetical protein HLUCCA12_02850 [Rhodobacteraceae bacterium HLUCCA12]|nr:MAG: hypothetical protein HLUCCA12_02850 [Rhodobacteraceae bacterium HLUCCA12]